MPQEHGLTLIQGGRNRVPWHPWRTDAAPPRPAEATRWPGRGSPSAGSAPRRDGSNRCIDRGDRRPRSAHRNHGQSRGGSTSGGRFPLTGAGRPTGHMRPNRAVYPPPHRRRDRAPPSPVSPGAAPADNGARAASLARIGCGYPAPGCKRRSDAQTHPGAMFP